MRRPGADSAIRTRAATLQIPRPQAYSALVSGGGLKTGQVIGATNRNGEHPVQRPTTPQDLLATIYRHLGIGLETAFDDFFGRPIPILPHGSPTSELL